MKPILINIPTVIETPRLILRAPQITDAAEVNEAVIESFNELKNWMPWAQTQPTLSDTEENIRQACADWITRTDLRILVYDKITQRFIASAGLHRIKWNIPSFEIGYWCRTSALGHGYITEATNALTRLCFQELKARRVALTCDTRNDKSIAVIKRLGFELEGHLRSDSLDAQDKTKTRDTFVFSRLNINDLPDLEVSFLYSEL